MKCYPSVCTASKENSMSDNTTKERHNKGEHYNRQTQQYFIVFF